MIAVKLNNNVVIDFQENINLFLPEGFDELWTEEVWEAYKQANRQVAVLLLNNIVDKFIVLPFALSPTLPEGFTELWTKAQWNSYVASRQVVQQRYTREEIEEMATAFQEKDFNANALVYLTQVKIELRDTLRANLPENQWLSNLPYAMVMAIEVYILKIWAKYNLYRLQLLDNQLITEVDFHTVGEPPCWRGDVEWVVSPSYQALQPNRFADTPEKLTIEYYQNYIAQNS